MVFVSKGGRVGHSVPKDYRPISLTSFLLKTLERLVDRKISEVLVERPFFGAQNAYQKRKSTHSALHEVLSFIETELQNKGCTLAVLIDIESAFINTTYDVMKACAAEHGVSEAIIRWIRSMLTRRLVVVRQGKTEISGQDKLDAHREEFCPPNCGASLWMNNYGRSRRRV